jgi:5,10-methylenetetrahydromethanopterin reductase
MVDEKLVDGLINLKEIDRNELTEDLLSFVMDSNLELTQQEKSIMYQFARGYYNKNVLYQVLNVINNADSAVVSRMADKYLKLQIEPDLKVPKPALAAEWMRLSELDRDAVKDDLLTFFVENNVPMTAQDKSVAYQFARGHYSENMLTQVIQIVNNADPAFLGQLANKYQGFVKPELKPEVKIQAPSAAVPSASWNLEGLFAADLVADLVKLDREAKEELAEELISAVVDREVQMTPPQKSAMDQFVKGHYSAGNLSQVLSVINTLEPALLTRLSERYHVKPSTTDLAADFMGLTALDRDALQEDLLDFVLDNKLALTVQQKSLLGQFARGHYSKNTLLQVFEIVNGADPGAMNRFSDKYLKLVKTELKPEVELATPTLKAPAFQPTSPEQAHFKNLFAYDLVKDLIKLPETAKEELREDLITYVAEHRLHMSPSDKAAMDQFVKGHHNLPLLSQVIQIVNTTESDIVNRLSAKYLKLSIESDLKLGLPTQLTADLTQNILSHTKSIRKEVAAELVDDLFSIFSKTDLKAIGLSHHEDVNLSQLARGHTNPATLANAIQVGLRILEASRTKAPWKRAANSLRFGVELVPTIGLDALVDIAQKLEGAGLDNLWMTDQYKNMDPYVTLTMMAKATSTADLGIGIANPYVVPPASTASAIASLDQVANKRMVLGLGPAPNATFNTMPLDTQTLSSLYETVQAYREFWTEPSPEVNVLPGHSIPIYIGAKDAKTLEVAGEIGDGVLVNYSNEIDLSLAKQAILAGAKKGNKSLSNIDIAAYTCFSVADDAKLAIKATVPLVAFLVAASPAEVLQRHDLNADIANKLRGYLAHGDMANAFRLVDAKFIEAFSISGTTQQCLNKIESLRKVGVNQFVFGSPLGPQKAKAIELISQGILASYNP